MTLVLVVFLALFIGSFVKGSIGFGLPLVATPILIFFYPLGDVITLLLLPVLAANFQQCFVSRQCAYVLKRIWPMIMANALILLTGGWFIVNLDVAILRVFVGILILAHVLLAERIIFNNIYESRVRMYAGVCGLVSGVLGCLTSFMSFPSVQYLYSLRLTKDEFIFAVGTLLATGFLSLWVGIGISGFDVIRQLDVSFIAIVPVLLGMWSGNLARNYLNAELFRLLVRGFLAASGVTLIVRDYVF